MPITQKNIGSQYKLLGSFASEAAMAASSPNFKPVANDLYFNTTEHAFYYYTGSAWAPAVSTVSLAADCKPTYALNVTDTLYEVPVQVMGFTAAQRSCADTSNDTVTLGQITLMLYNTVPGRVADIGTATTGRRTCAVNAGTAAQYVQPFDTASTKINGVAKRLLVQPGGWVVLEETTNDNFIIVAGAGVTLANFAA